MALKSTVVLLPEGNNGGVGDLGSLSSDTSSQLDVLGHDGDPLGVNGTQVGVLEESNEVSLTSLLQSHHRGTLESKIGLEVLSDLTDKTLERQLPQEELGRLLVSPDLSESDGSRSVPMGFLDSSSCRGALPGCLGGKLFSGSLSSGGLTGGLLCSGHFDFRLEFIQVDQVQNSSRICIGLFHHATNEREHIASRVSHASRANIPLLIGRG